MMTWQVRTFAVVAILALPSTAFAAPVPAPFSLDADVGSALVTPGDGAFSLSNATGAAPVRGCFEPIHLSRDGDAVVLSATMSRSVAAGNLQFRMGLFDARDRAGTAGHLGYFVGSSANSNPSVLFRRNGLGETPYWSGISGGTYLTGSAVTTPSAMPAGTYSLSLTITRVDAITLRLDYAMVRSDGGYSMIGSFEDRAPQQLAEDLAYDCAGFFLNGSGFSGTIALEAIDVRHVPAAGTAPVVARAALADLRVMTFNIRYAGNEPANYSWNARRPRVARVIRDAAPDILGVQEALSGQVVQMRSDLAAYGFYGVGRNDGVSAGEHAGIFFLASRFTLVDSGSFWLSETPSVPGTTFSTLSGATPRIASWVVLSDTITDRRYFVLNTHWDNQDQNARERSAALIRERVAELAGGLPVLLLADFNATETSAAATTLIGTNVTGENRLIDAFRRVTPIVGEEERTFQSFTTETSGARIDFVLHSPELQATSARIVRDTVDGYLPSDHYPVIATFNVAIPSSGTIDVDGGVIDIDAGMSDIDAGVIDVDAGVIDVDAGLSDKVDGGTADASMSDAGSIDASAGDRGDAAAGVDASARVGDGGPSAGPATSAGGCSVTAAPGHGARPLAVLFAIAALLARRRRAADGRAATSGCR